MLFLVDRHSSLLVGICMECIKERYMPVLLSSISLFGKALFYTQFGMASITVLRIRGIKDYFNPGFVGRSLRQKRLVIALHTLKSLAFGLQLCIYRRFNAVKLVLPSCIVLQGLQFLAAEFA